MKKIKKPAICVLGDGGWGTTLAVLLSRKGFPVSLWGAFEDYAGILEKTRVNKKFLPGIRIPREVEITSDPERALLGKDLVVVAVPSEYLRKVMIRIKGGCYPRHAAYLSVTKGIEIGSLKRMSEVIRDELSVSRVAVLSGPTIAQEVARGVPTAAVVACADKKLRNFLQDIFMMERFRVYTNDDVIGVELGGSLKNVIAIACGVSDGLGFGTNTKAALLSRGLAEISRLGQAMGAKAKTFSGISGLGDLVTTCISQQSRNRFVGEQIGKGNTLKQIQSHMQMVAEGVPTAKSALDLSRRYNVEMPIVREVYNLLYKNKSPLRAVRDLMTRRKKQEC
ncbi:MAG: NAD(P)-dependent glycerol-3-phosphate dehydrogenase [Candidatus Omnitrophica bacterium]|nr:NAD(P)-dependent glycerol-3-phosphate dehydrogenase [Candidatus Omnitrophota bacterium]MDD5512702.1 NAD(P)-dependent glycerol-3-phosphate dehydrogenase [Candidatus Omnitrophota bacterium]